LAREEKIKRRNQSRKEAEKTRNREEKKPKRLL
jgi:hypothetical protein